MRKLRSPFLFTLALIPIAAVSGWFVGLYQFDIYDPSVLEETIAQVGSLKIFLLVTAIQTMVYAAVCGFFGYLLADKLGLMKPICFEKSKLRRAFLISAITGILFSLDYWTFGKWIPGIKESISGGLTRSGVIASVLYGGIMEEIMLRLFMMSLIAWVLWKLFFKGRAAVPNGVLIAANMAAALLFAAGHIPATITVFGELTPGILLRCFLLNGGFGLVFGWLYRKYGIQYAMVGHALTHIVSKLIWFLLA